MNFLSCRFSVRSRAGFTLIELLTVIAIIGILASILIPVVGSARKRAREANDTGTLRGTGAGVLLFLNEAKTSLAADLRNAAKMEPYLGSQTDMAKAFYSEEWMDVVGRQPADVDYPCAYTINGSLWPSETVAVPGARVLVAANRPLLFSGVRLNGSGAYVSGGLAHVNPVYSGVAQGGPTFDPAGRASARALTLFSDGSVRVVDYAKDNRAEWWTAAE
jgi:prepilin-type N-terminal cleavage/methylation domain-containing protein